MMTLPNRSSDAALRLVVDASDDEEPRLPSRDTTEPNSLFLVFSAMSEPPSESQPRTEDSECNELMLRVRVGDVAAFELIVDRYWRRTFLYVKHLVSDPDRAYDVTQETFSRLWEKKESWKRSGSVGGWLLRTARNLVITEQRKWKVRMRWTLFASREEAQRPRTPLEEAEGSELRLAISKAIEDLSPRRREVFVLFHLQNLSYREIAEVLDIRTQTVANYLQAAVAQLRVSLAPFFPALSSREEGSEAFDPDSAE